ncbi:MAG: sigma-E factor negative regulatory protein [Proteobacteria bacterium]|uniref:sigma-E factor negative regulatory protein n=1 Tax=Rudaea sp. TaxID=2136325 RepID=UPI00321F7D51|nr:sigma-E factor negative regulatory protein [Pseudomonadota bacterium]
MNPNQAMADSLGEQLSALMDGELARDQVRFLLRGVEAQSDLARRWSNYHLVSATLKRECVAVVLPADFADGVIARLDADVAVTAVHSSRRVGFGVLRWVGGGAIAAAVAVVALTVSHPPEQGGGPALAVAAQAPAHASSQPYLPLARPLANAGSPLFDYAAVQPASYEQVVPSYYLPDGSEPAPERIEIGGVSYVLRAQRPPVQDSVQQAAAPAQR